MIFYLGTHEPSWLKCTTRHLFVSRRRLARLKSFTGYWYRSGWALDSGGFSELSMYGEWKTSPEQYAEEVQLWAEQIGMPDWAAIQDWMCEPHMLEKTGKTISEHQELTVESYRRLQELAPSVRWAPVLQGWTPDDYLSHLGMYESAGFNLHHLNVPVVGVGTMCRRQGTRAAEDVLSTLAEEGLRLHGFGLKVGFFKRSIAMKLQSCDSMAWSFRARRSPPLEGCNHKSCANCLRYALDWREKVLSVCDRPRQGLLV